MKLGYGRAFKNTELEDVPRWYLRWLAFTYKWTPRWVIEIALDELTRRCKAAQPKEKDDGVGT